MAHADFTKKQFDHAQDNHNMVRLVSVTVRDPESIDAVTVSLAVDLSTANEIMNFILGAGLSKNPSVRAMVTEAP